MAEPKKINAEELDEVKGGTGALFNVKPSVTEPNQDEGTSSKPYSRFINPSIAILKRVIDIKKKLK